MPKHVGVIGLGAMGSAMACRLLQHGVQVTGYDVRNSCIEELQSLGGKGAASPASVAQATDCLIISLNSETAFHEVLTGAGGIASRAGAETVVIDTCTLAVEDKSQARELLRARGAELLDCTVSGNRNSILEASLCVYASGDEAAFRRIRPVLATFSKEQNFLGEFGNASKLKFILNHLVTIHNAAAAEAMALAERAGLDLAQVHELVTRSFASSRIYEARGRMMVEGDYVKARGTYGLARKDARFIADFARSALMPTPVFQAALQMHVAGMAAGYTENDTASLFEVYRRLAGAPHRSPQTPRMK